MPIHTFENINELNEYFEQYKVDTKTKWRKIDSRGPLYINPGIEMARFIRTASRSKHGATRNLSWAPVRNIKDDIPYIIVSKHVYACHFGPPFGRSKLAIKKDLEKLEERKKNEMMGEKLLSRLTKHMINCPAKARLWYLLKFPHLKSPPYGRDRRTASKKFQDMLFSKPKEVTGNNLYILELPDEQQHCEHPEINEIGITSNGSFDRVMQEAIESFNGSFIASDQSRSFTESHQTETISQVVLLTGDDYEDLQSENEHNDDDGLGTSSNSETDVTANEPQSLQRVDWSRLPQFDTPEEHNGHRNRRSSDVSGTSHTGSQSKRVKLEPTIQNVISEIEEDKGGEDADRLFLLSLHPQLKRLPYRKSSEVKMEFMRILHEAAYDC